MRTGRGKVALAHPKMQELKHPVVGEDGLQSDDELEEILSVEGRVKISYFEFIYSLL